MVAVATLQPDFITFALVCCWLIIAKLSTLVASIAHADIKIILFIFAPF